MPTLDQSFSSQNFGMIFNLMNRKGKIDITKMSEDYQSVVIEIKNLRAQINELKKRKEITWSHDDKSNFDLWNEKLSKLGKSKIKALDANLEKIACDVNRRDFRFSMSKHFFGEHEEFTIDSSELSAFYAIRQLQYNMKRTFKVEMANRHTIMSSLKKLLNMKMPIYIIRTDVSGFFESIPQNRMLTKINENTLLSYKSKAFIKGIIQEYEVIKDTTLVDSGKGIPRGIGISSMLSEIYMKDIDNSIRNRKEVIYYVRYVDDIFMIMTSIGLYASLEKYYLALSVKFAEYGLTLKSIGNDKCQLIDWVNHRRSVLFDYLGYSLSFSCGKGNALVTKFGLSSKKKDNLLKRIDSAYKHFENYSKINIKQARRDLLDALAIITGNIRLNNSKSGVKVGLYYNNDLIDEESLKDLDNITKRLHDNPISVYYAAFRSDMEKNDFMAKLHNRINKIDLAENWKSKRMYDFSVKRVTEIMKWL